MAALVDASSQFSSDPTNAQPFTYVGPSVSAPAGALVLVYASCNAASGQPTSTINISVSGGHTAILIKRLSQADGGSSNAPVGVWGFAANGSAFQVTQTATASGFAMSQAVYVITGADTSNIAGLPFYTFVGTGTPTISGTASQDGSLVVFGLNDWNNTTGLPAGATGMTQDLAIQGSADAIPTYYGHKSVNTGGFSAGINALTGQGGTNAIGVLVDPAATGAIPYSPPGAATLRDSGEVPWIQRDRRDANTLAAVANPPAPWVRPPGPQTRDYGEAQWVQGDRRGVSLIATAANPLTSPLDSAWQAAGGYWHRYNDQLGAQRAYYPQRVYFDPSLLTPAGTDPLTAAAGVGGDMWRRTNTTATHEDRRAVQAQRLYLSEPGLLSTALLEDVLLANGETLKRAIRATTHASGGRWWIPQQPQRESPPGLLDTAQLEGVLLGGADDARHRLAAAYRRRDWTPVQRPYLSDPLLLVDNGDPLTIAAGVGADMWRRYHTPETHDDRRQVPQQPARVMLYFDTGPDLPPLTLAWGVGGNLWHLYNRPALRVATWRPQTPGLPVQHICVILRPFEGVIGRPIVGVTARLDEGVITNEC